MKSIHVEEKTGGGSLCQLGRTRSLQQHLNMHHFFLVAINSKHYVLETERLNESTGEDGSRGEEEKLQ